jgi:hypothetical protein
MYCYLNITFLETIEIVYGVELIMKILRGNKISFVDQFAVRERNFAQVCQHKFKNLNYRILFWILQKNGKWSYCLKNIYDTSLSHYVRCYDYKYSSMFLRLRKYSSISRSRKCFWLRCANDILTLKNQKKSYF